MIDPAVNQFGLTLSSVPLGTQPTTAQGTAVTPGAILTYGAYAQVPVMNGATTATSDDSWEVEIGINSVGITTVARDCIVTVGWDPAGGTNYGADKTTRIDHLLCSCAAGYMGGAGGLGGTVPYNFKLRIPAGSTVAAKAMVNSANLTAINVYIKLRCRPSRSDIVYRGSYVDTYGISVAGASGTAVTPGTTTRGAYVSLGALTDTYYQWEYGMGCNNGTMSNLGYEVDIAIGDATNKDVVIEGAVYTSSSAETLIKQAGNARTAIAGVGSTVFCRAQCNATPNTGISVAAYAVGGAS